MDVTLSNIIYEKRFQTFCLLQKVPCNSTFSTNYSTTLDDERRCKVVHTDSSFDFSSKTNDFLFPFSQCFPKKPEWMAVANDSSKFKPLLGATNIKV